MIVSIYCRDHPEWKKGDPLPCATEYDGVCPNCNQIWALLTFNDGPNPWPWTSMHSNPGLVIE